MNNLSFNKNSFIKSTPATLSKPIINKSNKLGRREIEEIREDMHLLNKHNSFEEKREEIKPKDIQHNQLSNLNSLKAFIDWNRK